MDVSSKIGIKKLSMPREITNKTVNYHSYFLFGLLNTILNESVSTLLLFLIMKFDGKTNMTKESSILCSLSLRS